MSANSAISRVLNYPAYAHGMEDAVVDLVVIQWIMQKLKVDRMRLSAQFANDWQNFDESN
ncbi:MAG: hypothetical protein JST89_12360 [Cyanobacteria bacterium SZAS-4]|nr:hypothetical protein [Cyanobacteria bacterium SZAS-4]